MEHPEDLTGPGGAFEIVDEDVLGERDARVQAPGALGARPAPRVGASGATSTTSSRAIERITFREHLDQVAALAHVLRDEYGVGRGDRVAILAANCPEWMVAFWATVSLGAIAASMNAWWADPELAHALDGARADGGDRRSRAARAGEGARARLRRSADRDRVEFAELVARGRGAALPDAADRRGRPGGDPVHERHHRPLEGRGRVAPLDLRRGQRQPATPAPPRRPAARGIGRSRRRRRRAPARTTLVTVPLFHASGLYGFIVLQLATGGKLVMRPGRFDPDDVLRLIEEERVTMWAGARQHGSAGRRAGAPPRAATSRACACSASAARR